MAKMLSTQTVYYGPNPATYLTNGSVSKDQTVTPVWKENNYLQIEFTVNGKKRRGFVPTSSVDTTNGVAGITNARAVRYLTAEASTFDGPGSAYTENNPLPKGKKVWWVGQKPDGYACVEYSIGANDDEKKIRVYVTTSKMTDAFIGTTYRTFVKDQIIPSGYPYAGATVSQGFNDTTTSTYKGHLGYDMTDFSTIKPIYSGTVVYTNTTTSGANGRVVCIKHTLNGHTFYSAYCHLASVSVSKNETVTTATQIGIMGGSGSGKEDTYNKHLHLAVFKDPNNTGKYSPYGYCADSKKERFELIAKNYANPYYYGPNEAQFPRCNGIKFYAPYGVITSNGAIFDKC